MSNRDDALGGKSNHLQQIFNKVSTHLLEQNERSVVDTTGTCAYRGESGKMCAVGCLINDHAYSQSLEGGGVRSQLEVQWALEKSGIEFDEDGMVMRLLSKLQLIHDTKEESDWAASLSALANELGLKFDMRGIR